MSYYYKKIISNDVIYQIEKMLYEGKTYKAISQITGVSESTICKIKKGKITSERNIKDVTNLIPVEEVSEVKRQLVEARKKILEQEIELSKRSEEIEVLKNHVARIRRDKLDLFNLADTKIKGYKKEIQELNEKVNSMQAMKKTDIHNQMNQNEIKRTTSFGNELKRMDLFSNMK